MNICRNVAILAMKIAATATFTVKVAMMFEIMMHAVAYFACHMLTVHTVHVQWIFYVCTVAYPIHTPVRTTRPSCTHTRSAGVPKRGYSFKAKLVRQYVAPLPPLQICTKTAPTQIARGSTAVYTFLLTTARTYPGCLLRLPISIEAQTDMTGVTLSADSGWLIYVQCSCYR